MSAKLSDRYAEAAIEGDLATIREFIRSGEDINAKDYSGYISSENIFVVSNTALIRAAANGHSNVVNDLLQNGVDVNAKGTDGYIQS